MSILYIPIDVRGEVLNTTSATTAAVAKSQTTGDYDKIMPQSHIT